MLFTIAIISTAFLGLTTASPVSSNNRRYVAGTCGIHVTQYQKNENGVGGDYQYDIQIKDGVGAIIGGANHLPIPDLQSATVDSELPFGLVVTSGAFDSDPVGFAYAGYIFSSSNGCSAGDYDNGARQMDCGFGC
ncbi:hypothetical protein GQX73_g1882 [Xylaria multiplex]|uniref:Uncharacterized protein n=1 Tax=Xylaria multiplex TaxID=323545 RepID=A0A7C8IZU4_9PEZI|nr:hypothetical protein GQX73_g1882 [Xylaria multiplex]